MKDRPTVTIPDDHDVDGLIFGVKVESLRLHQLK